MMKVGASELKPANFHKKIKRFKYTRVQSILVMDCSTEFLVSKLAQLKLEKSFTDFISKLKEDSMQVQSLIFPKDKFSKRKAVLWAKKHGFKVPKIDETENSLRIRQKNPSQFTVFKTKEFSGSGVKAVVAKAASEIASKFSGLVRVPMVSKMANIKNELQIPIPMEVELWILKTGPNKDGTIRPEDLTIAVPGFSNRGIIDFHDMDDMSGPTRHKISDVKGYTGAAKLGADLNEPNVLWVVAPGIIHDRAIAYQLYLKEIMGEPLEISAEFRFRPLWKDGVMYQTNIKGDLISIVKEGNIKGNQIRIKNISIQSQEVGEILAIQTH